MRVSGDFFSMDAQKVPHAPSRGACVVSKKVAPRATQRNFIKRRARSILARLLDNTSPPLHVVVYARQGALAASFRDLEQDIQKMLRRIRRGGAAGFFSTAG